MAATAAPLLDDIDVDRLLDEPSDPDGRSHLICSMCHPTDDDGRANNVVTVCGLRLSGSFTYDPPERTFTDCDRCVRMRTRHFRCVPSHLRWR